MGMDLNRVFNLFSGNLEKTKELELENFKQSPTFKVKMFIKLIRNGEVFKKNLINLLNTSNIPLNTDDVEGAGEFLMYVRAYFWIEQVGLEDIEEFLSFIDVDEFKLYLLMSIKYFEVKEEYEKCAHLNSFLGKLKDPCLLKK
jgi:hypothetical protein